MLVAGLLLIFCGLPCVAFGMWLKNAPPASVKASKKSKRRKKVEAPKGANASGFIYGGAVFTAIGLFALARYFFQF